MSSAATTLTAQPDAAAAAATQDWRTTLPEDIRGEESIKNFKDVADLTKGFIETKKLVGNATKIPKADAKPEEWDTFYSKLGRPESPDKYDFKMPDGTKVDEALIKEFRTAAHTSGLQPRQAQGLLDWFNKTQGDRMTAYSKTMEDGVGKLKTEWGGKFDEKLSVASRAVKEMGGDELISLLEETGLGNHPTLVKFFAKLGESTMESQLIVGDGGSNGQETKDEILRKIEEIEKDTKHPYNDSRAPHAVRLAAMRQVSELYKQLG